LAEESRKLKMDEPTLLVGGAGCLLVLLVAGIVASLGPRTSLRRSAMFGVAIPVVFCIALVEWIWLDQDVAVAVFQAAVASVVTSALLVASHRRGWRAVAILIPWASLVLAPVSYSVFDVEHGYLSVTVGTLDFAGGLTLAVCTGSAALVFAVVSRRRRALESVDAGDGAGRHSLVIPILVVPVLAIVALVIVQICSELAFDTTTTRVLHVVGLAAAGGFIGWVATMIVTSRPSALLYSAIGALAGVVAVLPFAPWLDETAAVVVGLSAGLLGELSRSRAQRSGLGHWSVLLGALLVPGLLGTGAAGIVANPPGLIYSGHTDLLVSQLVAIALTIAWSGVVALALAVALIPRRQARSEK
jgi:ammonium transporter, Amt family